MQWSTCGEDSRTDVAAANGGRAAGWFLLDDLLLDPGIGLGKLPLESCPQAVALLAEQTLNGEVRTQDAAYMLAAQLLTAALNLAAGTESCPAAEDAYNQAQLLLAELDFDGVGRFLGPPRASGNVDLAESLTTQLAQYNTGSLCR
jgi:hypothetical protein